MAAGESSEGVTTGRLLKVDRLEQTALGSAKMVNAKSLWVSINKRASIKIKATEQESDAGWK